MTIDLATLDLFTPAENARSAAIAALSPEQRDAVNALKRSLEESAARQAEFRRLRRASNAPTLAGLPDSAELDRRADDARAFAAAAAVSAIDAHYQALDLGVPAELLRAIGPSLEAA